MTGKIVGAIGKERYYIDGEEVSKRFFDLQFPDKGADVRTELSGKRVKASDALAVHPRQVEAARADAKKKGVPTEFLPDGRPIIRSRAHQKAYLKAYNFFNRDGGYGD